MFQKARTLVVLLLLTALWGCDSGSSAAVSGTPAVQSVDGFIEGTLDGETRKWHITSGEVNGENASQSSWEHFAGTTRITLFGHSRPDTLIGSREGLMLIITTTGVDASAEVLDAEVVYLSGGMTQGYGSNEEGGFARLVTDSIRSEGDSLSLSGYFEAGMSFRSLRPTADAPDQQRLTLKDGRFEATVRQSD